MERAIDRLLQFIEYLKKTDGEVKNAKVFEKKCGLSNSYIANSKKSNGSIGSDTIAKILSSFPQLNVEWICTGRGDMLKKVMAFFSEILGSRNVSIETARDNSMFPVIEQGSMVAVSQEPENELICGQIYAIYMPDDSIFFRYVSKVESAKILVVPANREPQYGTGQELNKKKIKEIKRVVGVVKSFL